MKSQPILTDSLSYLDDTGAAIHVLMYGSDTVEVHFMQYDDVFLKAFTAYRSRSASGAQYTTPDKRFVFWSKGDEATIFGNNDQVLFSGTLSKKYNNSLAQFESGLSKGMSLKDINKQFGEPHKDIGSGIHIYVYPLLDGTALRIGYTDQLIYAHHVDDKGQTIKKIIE